MPQHLMQRLQDDCNYEGIEKGACNFLVNPIPYEELKMTWKHVYHSRLRKKGVFTNAVSEVDRQERSESVYQSSSDDAATHQSEGSSGLRMDWGSPPHHVIGSAAPVNLQFRPPSVSHSNDHHQFIAAPTSMNELDKEISLEGLDNLILDCLNNSSEEPIKDVATKDQLVIQQVGPLSVEMMTQLQLNHNVIGNSGPPNHMIRSAAPANLQFRPPSVFLAAEQYQFDGNSGPHHTIRSAAPANLHRSPSVPPATNHHQFIATPTSINEVSVPLLSKFLIEFST
ncbi:hypothetical protein CDL15_Pgr018220 [Punica granatum]|uniref:Response regulatory domain-containing protein n=1 Tax=Punica granatum TaxID=22663 RepID=A0A218WHN7_PUNGR|nr:hypothetical protein CDL15_Pgr018220 [Punica granatum]